MPEIIKEGYLSLKEEGLRAWIWSKRYCVLRDQSLTFHRNEVRNMNNKYEYFFFSATNSV
jgi:SLT domain-containing protein